MGNSYPEVSNNSPLWTFNALCAALTPFSCPSDFAARKSDTAAGWHLSRKSLVSRFSCDSLVLLGTVEFNLLRTVLPTVMKFDFAAGQRNIREDQTTRPSTQHRPSPVICKVSSIGTKHGTNLSLDSTWSTSSTGLTMHMDKGEML